MFKSINWIAVVIAVVLLEALGFLWYGVLVKDAWTAAYQATLGHAPDMSNAAVAQSIGVINTVILVTGLAWVFWRMGVNTLAGIGAAVAVWFFFDFTTMAIDYIYMGLSQQLVLINMGYQLVSYLVAGAVLGLMPPKATAVPG